MTLHRLVPSEIEAERLSDLLNDARAIPAAAFALSRCATRRVLDLTVVPTHRAAVRIPDATVSLMEAAEYQLAGYRR